MYNQLYSTCNSSSSRQCFNHIRTLREQFSASCGNRFRCLRKAFPQCAVSVPAACGNGFRSVRKPFPLPAETYSAVCGKRSRTLRVLCPHVAASQCAETVSAGCGTFPAACGNCFRRVRIQFPQCADPLRNVLLGHRIPMLCTKRVQTLTELASLVHGPVPMSTDRAQTYDVHSHNAMNLVISRQQYLVVHCG